MLQFFVRESFLDQHHVP